MYYSLFFFYCVLVSIPKNGLHYDIFPITYIVRCSYLSFSQYPPVPYSPLLLVTSSLQIAPFLLLYYIGVDIFNMYVYTYYKRENLS